MHLGWTIRVRRADHGPVLTVMRRHPAVTAVVVWLLGADVIRIAMKVDDGSDYRWWMDVALVAFSLYGAAAAWYVAIRGLRGATGDLNISFLVFGLGLLPFSWGVAGVFLGASVWASWFAALAVACGLGAWVHSVRKR